MTKRNLCTYVARLLLPALVLGGCASTGLQKSTGTALPNVSQALEAAEITLPCTVSCSGTWGANRQRTKALYHQQHWLDLATNVAQIGFNHDLGYFYLGRAAEAMGYADAARIYYKLSLAAFSKCDGLLNACDGIDIPVESQAGLKRVASLAK